MTTPKDRWKTCLPDSRLTWGGWPDGKPFIRKAQQYDAFGPEKTVLEIGPGYGRLRRACLELGVPCRAYLGMDLSQENVTFLSTAFPGDRFWVDDVEEAAVPPCDTVLSSLTFKHLYPTCEKALVNVALALKPKGVVVFDAIEGPPVSQRFEPDGVFVKSYSREELGEIAARCGLVVGAFDTVAHAPDRVRLLVVAGRAQDRP